MNSIKNNPLKYLKIFSLIYIILNVILRIVYMAIRTDLYADYIYFNNTMFVLSVFGMLLSYAPFVMFMVYIFACYSKNRNHILLTIAYILSAVIGLITLVVNLSTLKNINYWTLRQSYTIVSCIFSVVSLAFTVFYIVDCCSKFKYLKISQKLITIQLIFNVFYITTNIFTAKAITAIITVSWLLNITYLISLFTYYIFWKYGVSAASAESTENALYDIKKQFDDGIITEQEYNQKKTEILNKL